MSVSDDRQTRKPARIQVLPAHKLPEEAKRFAEESVKIGAQDRAVGKALIAAELP
jgi:hypothetical protein